MNKLMKVFFFVVISVWSVTSFAGWYPNQTITNLYAGEVGDRYSVTVSGTQLNPTLTHVNARLVWLLKKTILSVKKCGQCY